MLALRDFFKDFGKDRCPRIRSRSIPMPASSWPLSRGHTLGLAAYVDTHGQELFS
jgi:hypothetical protein